MKKILAFLAISVSSAMGQINNPTLRWVGTSPSGSCSAQSPIQVVISTGDIYTCQNGTWGKVGGNPITLPSTSNILAGNGSGGAADSNIAPTDVMRLSTSQTVTGAKTFTTTGSGVATTFTANGTSPAIILNGPGRAVSTNAFLTINDSATTSGNYGIADQQPGIPAGGNRMWILGEQITGGNSVIIQYNKTTSGPHSLGLGMWNSNNTLQIFADGTSSFAGNVTANVLPPVNFVARSQNGALNQTLVSSAAGAMYRISIASNCDTAVASAGYTVNLAYADTSGSTQNVSSGAISCTTLGSSSVFNVVNVANLKSGTAAVLTTTTTGAVSYDVAVTVEQITAN
jgi:hypothetical protein